MNNRDKFFEYMIIVLWQNYQCFRKDLPLMTTREELKVDTARDEQKKLIAKGWRIKKGVWEDY